MHYYIKTNVKSLFNISIDTVYNTSTKREFILKVTSNFKSNSVANDVNVLIPIPCDILNPDFEAEVGDVKYVASTN